MPEPTAETVRWVLIPGGTCRYGDAAKPRLVADLLVARTPLTRRQTGHDDRDGLPATGVDHTEAARLAAEVGGRLPTSVEWEWIAAGAERRPYPWGEQPWTPERAVLTAEGSTPFGPQPVGQHPAGAAPHGVLDLAGNVWEWTASPVMGGRIHHPRRLLRLQAAVRPYHVPQRRPRRAAQPRHLRTTGETRMSRHLELVTPANPTRADPTQPLVIVGCSAEKTATHEPMAALELYDGGCVPPLRARLGHQPRLRARVRFLSAEHGLVTADTPLRTYDRPLDPARATELRPGVWARLRAELLETGMPTDILVMAEPLYLVLIADLFAAPERPRVHWIPDHAHGWPQAATVLDRWKW